MPYVTVFLRPYTVCTLCVHLEHRSLGARPPLGGIGRPDMPSSGHVVAVCVPNPLQKKSNHIRVHAILQLDHI